MVTRLVVRLVERLVRRMTWAERLTSTSSRAGFACGNGEYGVTDDNYCPYCVWDIQQSI